MHGFWRRNQPARGMLVVDDMMGQFDGRLRDPHTSG
jgi:hypothetical protein